MSELVFAFHLTTQICVPAILVELLNSEVDATRQLLNQESMEEKGMYFFINFKSKNIQNTHFILPDIISLLKINHSVFAFKSYLLYFLLKFWKNQVRVASRNQTRS